MILRVSNQPGPLIRCLALVVAIAGGGIDASAAPPKIDYFFPPGGQRGGESLITAHGTLPTWPVQVWVDRPGITVTADAMKGKLRVVINQDASPGVYWLRLHDEHGASSLHPFLVDQLPEVEEVEPNDTTAKAQQYTLPVIFNGRLAKSGDVDIFAVTLNAGETVVASLRAHSLLGSPLDAVLQVCEVRERPYSRLAGSAVQSDTYVVEQNNDVFGLDPRVAFTARKAGTYLVRVFAFTAEPNSGINFAGGDNFIYRLSVTTSGVAEYALPDPSAAEGIRIYGAGLPKEGIVGQRVDTGYANYSSAFAVKVAGNVAIPKGKSPAIHDGNQVTTVPPESDSVIAGSLSQPAQSHTYRLAGKKGVSIRCEVVSRSLGLPLDAVLSIEDSSGKVLQRVDDTDKKADPAMVFAPPGDGDYLLRIRDLHKRGGDRFAYWLHTAPLKPQFELSVADDAFVVAPGKSVEIPVTISRKDGHKADFDLSVVATNDLLPPGISAAVVKSVASGPTGKAAKLVIAAAADMPPGGYAIRIVGQEADSESKIYASLPAVANFAEPPPTVWLTVTATP